jgi:hypothetical protein
MAVLEVQQIREVRDFDFQLTAANAGGSTPFVLYECSEARIRTAYGLAPTTKVIVNGFLKNLRLEGTIQSVDEVPFPEFALGTSDQSKTLQTYNVEWTAPRHELHFYTGKTTLVKRPGIAMPRLSGQNTRAWDALRYLSEGLSEDFGNGRRLACQFINVGYGLPDPTLDKIAISGTVGEEIFIFTDSSILTKSDVQNFTLWGDEIIRSNGGTSVLVRDTAQRYSYFHNFTPGALQDEFTFTRILKAGAYTLRALGVTEPPGGRITVFLNELSQGFLNFYSAAQTYDAIIECPIIVLADGLCTFRLRMAGRSAANTTGFTQKLTKLWVA